MQQIETSIQQRLTANGVRFTRGRRVVVQALTGADGPKTAAEIHQELDQSIPLSSLYRSLTVLTDCGILATHHGPAGMLHFELAEWITGHHHHLVCTACGAVIDAAPKGTQEDEMRHFVETMAKPHGFTPSGHRFEIEGTCSACR